MKRKMIYILSIMTIFLAVAIVADILGVNDRAIETDKPKFEALKKVNLTIYNTTDYIDGDYGKRCLTRTICEPDPEEPGEETCRSVINTCSNMINATLLDEWEEDRINSIAEATIKRTGKAKPAATHAGKTTITEKK